MRYTLRLLTAQQFQRAAALVCAGEVLRREDEQTLGRRRRSGSACGSAAAVSPNWYADAERADRRGPGGRRRASGPTSCRRWPARGAARRSRGAPRPARRRRRRGGCSCYCPNGEGADACPFSRTQSPRRACRSSPSTRRSTGYAAEPGDRHRRQVRPAALARLRRHAVRPGRASAARGTATGTTTSTRGPAAASRHNAKGRLAGGDQPARSSGCGRRT